MASLASSDENDDDSSSIFSPFNLLENSLDNEEVTNGLPYGNNSKKSNLVQYLLNRELYGRFTTHSKAKTEEIFNSVPTKCRFSLSGLLRNHERGNHVFMGFTLCGKYVLSFTETIIEDAIIVNSRFCMRNEYELYFWRFVPGLELKMMFHYKLFKQFQNTALILDRIYIMQFPSDPHKLICYGLISNTLMTYLTILTVPSTRGCKHCSGTLNSGSENKMKQGWCEKHGFILHYVLPMTPPFPAFDPHVSLAYPDHLVLNTGHYIHILNVNTLDPPETSANGLIKEDDKPQINSCTFNDTTSEISESTSDNFDIGSLGDPLLDDFNEYDLEGAECNKPFHELNISCEPLNVTGKSYHNTLVQNIVDPRLKRLQNNKDYLFSVPQSSTVQKITTEKSKIDIKNAEKAYEFTEENEKCEKISLFRKKRLAEKKYEFSEDNNENIVPFNSLRRERKFFHRSMPIRSPDLSSIFLSPRSPSMRSPMQSPSSRSGQFSPNGARSLHYGTIRNSPHHSKSPISPRDSARKFHVYSPSLDSDCSDSDSKLVLRSTSNLNASNLGENRSVHNGLLIVDPSREKAGWIKKVVRRYSNGDFENSSLLSGQSRDDYNIPIEIPLLAQTLTDQHLDVVPDFKRDQVTQLQLIVTQRTFDCEQFVHKKAYELCVKSQLEFLHCEDYDVKIMHVCPMDGHIVCRAAIKVGTKGYSPYERTSYSAVIFFSWNIITDEFDIIQTFDCKINDPDSLTAVKRIDIPSIHCQRVLVMDYNYRSSKTVLRDYHNRYEICLSVDDDLANVAIPNPWYDDDDSFDFY